MKKQPRKPAKKKTVKPAKKKTVKPAMVKRKVITEKAAGRYKSSEFKQTVVTLDAAEMATICNALEYYKANRLLAAFLDQRK